MFICWVESSRKGKREKENAEKWKGTGLGGGGYGNYRSKGFWQIREDEIQRQVKGLAFDRRKLLHLLSKGAFPFNRNPVKVIICQGQLSSHIRVNPEMEQVPEFANSTAQECQQEHRCYPSFALPSSVTASLTQ